jgi:hypothetical protein
VLFFIYLAFYAGFMGLAAFAPQSMGRPVLGGVNLAITYGMGLIVGALVVAALYMAACARNARLRGTGILPVSDRGIHGQDGHTTRGTGILPVSESLSHGQDGPATENGI